MPYKITLPDGSFTRVPDNVPYDEAMQHLRQKYPELYQPPAPSFGGALQKGIGSLLTGYGTLAKAPFVGSTQAAREGLEAERELTERYGEAADFGRVAEAYRSRGLLPAAGELAKQSGLAITENLPVLGSMAAGAALGETVFPLGGGLVGAGLAAFAPRMAGNLQAQVAAQQAAGQPVQVDPGRAAGFAAVQAPLDVASAALPLGRGVLARLFGPKLAELVGLAERTGDAAIAKEAETAARGILKSAARGVGINLAEQVPLQVAQAALSRLQSGQDVTSPEAIQEYGQAAYTAGVMSPLGVVGGVANRAAARSRIAAQKELTAPGEEPEGGQLTFAPNIFKAPEEERKPVEQGVLEFVSAPVLDEKGQPTGQTELVPNPALATQQPQRAPVFTTDQDGKPVLVPGKFDFSQIPPTETNRRQLGFDFQPSKPTFTITPEGEILPYAETSVEATMRRRATVEAERSQATAQAEAERSQATAQVEAERSQAIAQATAKAEAERRQAAARQQEGKFKQTAFPTGLFGKAGRLPTDEDRALEMVPELNEDGVPTGQMIPNPELAVAPEVSRKQMAFDLEQKKPAFTVTPEGEVLPYTETEEQAAGRRQAVESQQQAKENARTKAVELIASTGKVGIDAVRKATGLNRADTVSLLQRLEKEGIVTPPDGTNRRKLTEAFKKSQEKPAEAKAPTEEKAPAESEVPAEEAVRGPTSPEAERTGAGVEVPARPRAAEQPEAGRTEPARVVADQGPAERVAGGEKPREAPVKQRTAKKPETEAKAEQPRAAEEPKAKKPEPEIPKREVPVTQSARAADAIRRGKLDEALSHLMIEAGGPTKGGRNSQGLTQGQVSPLRVLAEALHNALDKGKALSSAKVLVDSGELTKPQQATFARLKKEGKLAEYDPRTNTFYFTEEGLNDRTMLHEMLHAATVAVLKRFETDPKSLTANQRAGAEHIHKLFEASKKKLGKEFKNAYRNVYEFVAHGATDEPFQRALASTKISDLEGKELQRPLRDIWDQFTRALAKMFNLDKYAETYLKSDRAAAARTGDNLLTSFSNTLKDILGPPEKGLKVPRLAETKTGKLAEAIEKAETPKERLRAIGESLTGGPELLKDRALNALSHIPGYLRDGFNGLLSMTHMDELYGHMLPSLKVLARLVDQRGAERVRNIYRQGEIVKKWLKDIKANKNITPQVLDRFYSIALNSTLDQAELLDRPEIRDSAGKITQRGRKHQEGYLYNEFIKMPKELREMYREMRDEYDRFSDEYVKKLTEGLNLTETEKLRAEYEKDRLRVYLPLFRRGKYWLRYKDNYGNDVSTAFRSVRERNLAVARLKNSGIKAAPFERVRDLRNSGPPPTGFLSAALEALKKQGVKDENVFDAVYETYLDFMPAESLRQRFRTREGRLGMEKDLITTYANVGSAMANMLNNIKHARGIDEALEKLYVEAKEHEDNPNIASVMRNVQGQIDFLRNPNINDLSRAVGAANYNWFLAGNVSSAVINMTHLPMVVYPMLAGKYGWGTAMTAFDKSMKNFKLTDEGTPPKNYEKLFEIAEHAGAIGPHVARELYELRKVPVESYTGISAGIMDKLNWMFRTGDRANREMTLMAAYDLEMARLKGKDGAGMTEGQRQIAAAEEAIHMVNTAYGSMLIESGPRLLQGNWARVLFMFKRFALNRQFILANLFKKAFKDESPEVRALARRQILGIYGMAFAFSGVAGMPLVGAGEFLANLLMDDKDDPYDARSEERRGLAGLAWKGPVNYLLNWEVSERSGWNDMFWKEDNKRLAEVGMFDYIMERAMGPTYSLVAKTEQGVKDFAKGDYERGLESMLPSAVANVMKGARYAVADATTTDGKKIGDVNAAGVISQMLGFAPADIAERRAAAGAMTAAQKKLADRKSALYAQAYVALMHGDSDAIRDVFASINRFSQKNPEIAFKPSEIRNNIKNRLKQELTAIYGVNINPKLAPRLRLQAGASD